MNTKNTKNTKDTKKFFLNARSRLAALAFRKIFFVPFVSFVSFVLLGAATQPLRIVSLVPALTEMLFAIGAGPSVVGVSSYDQYPPEVKALPRVGSSFANASLRLRKKKFTLRAVYASTMREVAATDLYGRMKEHVSGHGAIMHAAGEYVCRERL